MAPPSELDVLAGEFVVARLPADAPLPAWADTPGPLTAATRTSEELSIVAPRAAVPTGVRSAGPWRVLKVRGPLSFELTGVLSSLAAPLAQAQVSIFAISTYDTDYVLVRAESLTSAIHVLHRAGHRVSETS